MKEADISGFILIDLTHLSFFMFAFQFVFLYFCLCVCGRLFHPILLVLFSFLFPLVQLFLLIFFYFSSVLLLLVLFLLSLSLSLLSESNAISFFVILIKHPLAPHTLLRRERFPAEVNQRIYSLAHKLNIELSAGNRRSHKDVCVRNNADSIICSQVIPTLYLLVAKRS